MKPMRGFTLVELIVVIVVMAILTAVAAPRFFTNSQFDAPAFAQELASAARYAQKLAIATGCPVRLTLVSNVHYELKQPQNAPGASCDVVFTRNVLHPGTGNAFAGDAPGGVTIGGGPFPQTIVFDARGIPSNAADFSIAVGTQAVVIAARSGYVDVQ
jgi:MSHA pilin protein MshC